MEKAKVSCKNAGFEVSDHFLDIRKKVGLGSGAVREIDDTDYKVSEKDKKLNRVFYGSGK